MTVMMISDSVVEIQLGTSNPKKSTTIDSMAYQNVSLKKHKKRI